MELTKKDKILFSVILCLFFVHVIHGIYDAFINFLFYLALIFVTSWVLMIFYPFNLVRYFVLELPIIWPIRLPYLICCLLAWFSLFVLIKYTKGHETRTKNCLSVSHPSPNNEFGLSISPSTSLRYNLIPLISHAECEV